ncbi:MAG: tetratricopeptide repeat protein [Ignavibacteria bacterium]
MNTDPEPNYNISLDHDYQDFASYIFMGNRIENFTAYFNTYYKADEDFNEALDEYRTSLISFYNRRLDSLGITPVVSGAMKEKIDKAIERASKIIQFHKNSKYIDKAVLLIGKSYYFEGDYFNSERKFNEFLSKLSSSELADEAILFLGQTKVKLGKNEEGSVIFKNLVQKSSDNEIRSQAASALGIAEYNRGNYSEAVKYFKSAIDFSKNKERKAEGQFILAKILSDYKPELSSNEYKKVLDFTSDFDLTYYARLNNAKGLIFNKDFVNADEVLTDIRKKYRDVPEYTQLVDLELANNLYGQKKLIEAKEKYFEVIVKYPNTVASSDAYYFLAKHEEDINGNYINALINYKKAVEESTNSDFYRESSRKVSTFERYFTLVGNIRDTTSAEIPTTNAELEKYRIRYNEDKGIEQQKIENNTGPRVPKEGDGNQTGDGKGRPGGFKNYNTSPEDTLENTEEGTQEDMKELPLPTNDPPEIDRKKGIRNKNRGKDTTQKKTNDTLGAEMSDSLRAQNDSLTMKTKEDKVFNAYYELAELFIYNLESNDSAEHYLKILLTKFPESERQAKVLYTLGNFYKNTDRKSQADETFNKIISTYPNTVYAYESKKVMGIKVNDSDIVHNPVDEIFKQSMSLFNDDKFVYAIAKLQEVESQYPEDTMVAKALYGIGWIYENKFSALDSSSLNYRDSSIAYYKKLRTKFPATEYARKVSPMLDYMASLEVTEPTSKDTTNTNSTDTLKIDPEINVPDVKQEETPKEVIADPQKSIDENRLSQEEIDRLLKESEDGVK